MYKLGTCISTTSDWETKRTQSSLFVRRVVPFIQKFCNLIELLDFKLTYWDFLIRHASRNGKDGKTVIWVFQRAFLEQT